MAADNNRTIPDHNKVDALLELSRKTHWSDALQNVFGDSEFVKYVTSEQRTAIVDVLPLQPDQNILEIGPGYGQMTGSIARRVATVDAIEADAAQAEFCRIRMSQDGLNNVRVTAGGEEALLPYPDQAFDGVMMNLVFEWCAVRSTRPHPEVQQTYLAEIARVLKPGGFLFLSTKNRFALRLLTGGHDEHMAEKRFGSALPRAIGKMLMGGERSRGYLHSFGALKAMIERQGLMVETAYWALPDMRWPTHFLPFQSAAVKAAQRNPALRFGSPKIHWLTKRLPAGWVKYFAPGLVFLARKQQP